MRFLGMTLALVGFHWVVSRDAMTGNMVSDLIRDRDGKHVCFVMKMGEQYDAECMRDQFYTRESTREKARAGAEKYAADKLK